jgi:nucleotide-binding universal stress UspA family protein
MAPYVEGMARRYGARVTMLHALELPIVSYSDGPVYSAMDFQSMIDDGKQRVESFLKSEFQDIPTTRLMLEGEPAWRIAEYAEKETVDLIMMPTHGYGPFRRFLLGSVTAKVLHDVKCPVWTSAHRPKDPRRPAAIVTCSARWTFGRVTCRSSAGLPYLPASCQPRNRRL